MKYSPTKSNPKSNQHFIVACGGTGGHLFPGLAVAEALKRKGGDILLLVSEKEVDSLALGNRRDFRIEKLPSIGMPSPFSPAFLRFLRRGWESFTYCRKLLRHFQPMAVLGMGGFTSAAPIIAARTLHIPSFIHESNAIPGRANRLTAPWADHLLLGFQECKKSFPGRVAKVTGTPVRSDLGSPIDKNEALQRFGFDRDKKTLLVMGGSQGASAMNHLLFQSAPLLKKLPLQIIHLTGEREEDLAAINYQRDGVSAYVCAFYHRMNEAYSAADLVISRAGAASLSELSHFGLPSILFPYPFAADHHQDQNAAIFEKAGAAEILQERQTTPKEFVRLVTHLLENEGRRKRMAIAAHALLPDHAAQKVAEIILASVGASSFEK